LGWFDFYLNFQKIKGRIGVVNHHSVPIDKKWVSFNLKPGSGKYYSMSSKYDVVEIKVVNGHSR
jgi:hypothetical protein